MVKKYAGIGSRRAPIKMLSKIRNVASELAHKGYVLHTGGALGCDKAFIDGCQMAGRFAELWLPWQYYNGYISENPEVRDIHLEFTKQYHPAWHKCSEKAQVMHARNAQILLGDDLDSPVDFVVCWTPYGEMIGGTAQGLRIAIDFDIPIFNLATCDEKEIFEFLESGEHWQFKQY